MRILYATYGYKPAYRLGGPILTIAEVAERLVRKGHRVVVFGTNSNLDEDLDVPVNQPVNVNGVEVWYFKREEFIKHWLPFIPYISSSAGFLYAPAMVRELNRLVPEMDVVHTQATYVYPTYAAARAAFRFRKPLFYHQHGNFDPARLKFRGGKKGLYIKLVERPMMQRAAMLIALTAAEEQNYRALGVKTPCRIIPNGINVEIYRRQPGPAIGALGLSPDALVILFMARLHPIKGPDRLLQAFLQIHRQFPQAVLVMAGPDECGETSRYKNLVRQAGLAERVFFPGMVQGDLKLDLLARANLFCLPSDAEGFSIAVLEAMASGTAVLLSPGCHFAAVKQAGAGEIASPDPDSLAAALTQLLAQPDRLEQMGDSGCDLVTRNYSWDGITEQLIDAYLDGMKN